MCSFACKEIELHIRNARLVIKNQNTTHSLIKALILIFNKMGFTN